MKFHIITLAFEPAKGDFDTRELDAFCAHSQILSYQCACFQTHGQAYWTIWFCYESVEISKPPKATQISDQKTLTEMQEKCLAALKSWRNQYALKEGFPPYIIASNSLLVEIVHKNPKTISELLTMHGFGKQKAGKYGQDILSIVKKHSGL